MAKSITISRPDVVALIEKATQRFTSGNKTEVVALAMRRLQERQVRSGSLFGAHPGSVLIPEGVDMITALDTVPDAR